MILWPPSSAASALRLLQSWLEWLRVIGACCCLIVICWLGPARAAGPDDPDALHVGDIRWGFDGTVGRRQFTPVSIEVHNQSSLPWQGTLRLSKFFGRGIPGDATLESSLSLQGGESRWVQFSPYIMDEGESWRLRWGPEEAHSTELPSLRLGPRSTVLIYDPRSVEAAEGFLKRLPEDLFPQSVTSCDGLRGVVLQHAPFWQGARAQAFLEWLREGGRVYLLRNAQGISPRFPAPLEALNHPAAAFRVGAGVVRRLELSSGELDAVTVRREILLDDRPPGRGDQQANSQNQGNALGFGSLWDADDRIFRKLQHAIAFRRRWWLIYGCVAAYIFTLFPGCYWIGRGRRNVRGFYLAFTLATVLFSVFFTLLSRVDNTGTNRIATAAVAQEVSPGILDLTEWSMWRVAYEGESSASHPGSGHCYSLGMEMQTVKGTMYPGLTGSARFELPPQSMRSLLHKSRIAHPYPAPQAQELVADGGRIDRLRVSLTGCFDSPPISAYALHEDTMWKLDTVGEELQLPPRPQPVSISSFLDQGMLNLPQFGWGGLRTRPLPEEKIQEERKVFEELIPNLLAAGLGVTDSMKADVLSRNRQDVRLAVLVSQPAEQRAISEDFADQTGCVLFLFNLTSPAGTQP